MTKTTQRQPAAKAPAATSPLSRRQLLTSAALAAAASAVATGKPTPARAAAAPKPEIGSMWWTELQTGDPVRARAFYAGVVGWAPKIVALNDSSRPPAAGEKEYTLFTIEGREAAGAVHIDDGAADAQAAMWLTYIQVADVDAAAKRAVELGGKLLEAPEDVPNSGRIAIIEDVEGVRVGLITPVAG